LEWTWEPFKTVLEFVTKDLDETSNIYICSNTVSFHLNRGENDKYSKIACQRTIWRFKNQKRFFLGRPEPFIYISWSSPFKLYTSSVIHEVTEAAKKEFLLRKKITTKSICLRFFPTLWLTPSLLADHTIHNHLSYIIGLHWYFAKI
jgi:hypothetical protein